MRLRILVGVALLLDATVARSYDDLDYIVAVVDDDVLLASELVRLESVRKQMLAHKLDMPPNEVLQNQLLERLIMEDIQLQMGERAGVRIDDETLTKALEGIAAHNNMSLEQFPRALAIDGLDYREFREDVRREMVIARVQRSRVNSRVEAAAQEITVTARRVGRVRVPSLYFGGGTPSLLLAELIGGLLTAVRAFFDVADDAEVTLEVNPTMDDGRQTTDSGPSSVVSGPVVGGRSRPCLTWNEVLELHAAGIEFGSHTVNHPKLVELSWPQIEFELRHSKFEIEFIAIWP